MSSRSGPAAPPREAGLEDQDLPDRSHGGSEASTSELARQGRSYYGSPGVSFDYEELLSERREEVAGFVRGMQKTWREANPQYEEAEGVVAGVEELSEFDVILDAGSDGSDPETAVPFDVHLPDGRVLKKPGNFFFLTETSLFGTNEDFQARDVRADLDGDGKASFGEAVPDANVVVAVNRDFAKQAAALDKAARSWTPTREDALQALVTMTPTMSEYFGQWKNSRFIAGSEAKEEGFAASSRLQDIEDILSGLVLSTRTSVRLSTKSIPPRRRRQAGNSGACGHSPPACAPASRAAPGSRPSRPTPWAPRHSRERRRSPARCPRQQPSWESSSRRSASGGAHRRAGGLAAAGPAAAAPAEPWRAAAEVRDGLFDAQSALLLDERGADRHAERAADAYAGTLRTGLKKADPAAHREILGGLRRAARAENPMALAAVRGAVQAALFRGALAATLAAVERRDVPAARSWLLLRQFRTPTRYTRPGADATLALRALERGRTSTGAAVSRSSRMFSMRHRAGLVNASTSCRVLASGGSPPVGRRSPRSSPVPGRCLRRAMDESVAPLPRGRPREHSPSFGTPL